MSKVFEFDDWARDEKGDYAFDFDATEGRPSIYGLSNEIMSWVLFQNRLRVTVDQAAKAWNLPAYRIAEAIRLAENPYISLSSDGDDYTKVIIELDGE